MITCCLYIIIHAFRDRSIGLTWTWRQRDSCPSNSAWHLILLQSRMTLRLQQLTRFLRAMSALITLHLPNHHEFTTGRSLKVFVRKWLWAKSGEEELAWDVPSSTFISQGDSSIIGGPILVERQGSGIKSSAWDAAKLQRTIRGLQLELKLANERVHLLEANQETASRVRHR